MSVIRLSLKKYDHLKKNNRNYESKKINRTFDNFLNNFFLPIFIFINFRNLKLAENQIEELSAGLIDVDAKVAELKQQLSTYTKEAAEIEINLKAAQDKLDSAEGLVSKLNEEYERWGTQVRHFFTFKLAYVHVFMLLLHSLVALFFWTFCA